MTAASTQSDMPQVVYAAGSAEQAHLLVNALCERGFEAFVTNEGLQVGLGVLPFGLSTAPQVAVPARDALEARRIVLELVGERPPVVHRPFQFKMREVLFVIAIFGVFLAIERIIGWKLIKFIPLLIGTPNLVILFVMLVVFFLVVRRKQSERADYESEQ
jgi:hypothetical protein